MENHHAIKFGKPSISMGHLYHGYVSHSQRLNVVGHGEIWYPQMQWTIGWSSNDGKTKLQRGSQGEIIDELSLFHTFPMKNMAMFGRSLGPIPPSQHQLHRVSDSHPWPWTVVEISVNASHVGKIKSKKHPMRADAWKAYPLVNIQKTMENHNF